MSGYVIENVVKDARTRFHRAMAPATQRCKIYIAGQRLVPLRKIELSAASFKTERVKLRNMILEGKITLTTPEGIKITSTHTGEFLLFRTRDGAVKMLPRGEEPECFWASSAPEISPQPPPTPEPVIVAPVEPVVEVPAEVAELVEEAAVEEAPQDETEETPKRSRRKR